MISLEAVISILGGILIVALALGLLFFLIGHLKKDEGPWE
jgi:hypothetical protein